jgi:phytoene dehydrogenase-like protein
MAGRYDVIVIGAGLGGLTAAALLARAGRSVLVLERNNSVGGAASTYKAGDLVVEAALHETADPRDPLEPKHAILSRLGLLDTIEWVATGPLYEVRGGPLGAPFVLPEGIAAARAALTERFPAARAGIARTLADMECIVTGLGTLARGRAAFRDPREGVGALLKLAPVVRDWRRSLTEVFERNLGGDEAVKCALGANLAYYHDDPGSLWWIFFALAQGGLLASGGRYIRGGSQRLSNALARIVRGAGGEVLVRRNVTQIRLGADGAPSGVVHESRKGGDAAEGRATVVIGNAAPSVLAAMLPDAARERFSSAYGGQRLSTSLFSATFGMSVRPAELGVRGYSTFMLPRWMRKLSDYPRSADLLAAMPGETAPLITLVDYSAIDSGLGGPPYPVSVVGLDRLAHWSGLDKAAHDAKREAWRNAIVGTIDDEFPGFAAHVVAAVFNTARSMHSYLNAPEGAVYGFAPLPPTTPIWQGTGRSPRTPIPGLYLASSYAVAGGFTGAMMGGAVAADLVLAKS